MSLALEQHQVEIQKNLGTWQRKPLLREIYREFYERILELMDRGLPGRVVEIGSGIGNLKSHLPGAISTDLFHNPWLDVVCDGYELPFVSKSLSHLILFDVFHHLAAPNVFLHEARRVLTPQGRLILFEPYLSWVSTPTYHWFHHEGTGLRKQIDFNDSFPRPRHYYTAQGNATRLFFRRENPGWPEGWRVFHCASLRQLQLSALRRLQQTGPVPVAVSQPPATLRRHFVQVAGRVRRPVSHRPANLNGFGGVRRRCHARLSESPKA